MCGSDLERDYGAASADIDAIVQTNFSPNIKFVIQTGGSSRWDINGISSNKLRRYVVENKTSTGCRNSPVPVWVRRKHYPAFLNSAAQNTLLIGKFSLFGLTAAVCAMTKSIITTA